MAHHFRALILLVLLSSGAAMAIEEPRYTVESKTAIYEIRSYGSVLAWIST